ncbi:MAG: hypothetical protein WC289_04705 [Patescibacteria group bacterium]|jgi:hypothetical protein
MFTIDLSALADVNNPFQATLFLIQHGGWILLVFTVLYGAWIGWLEYIRNVYDSKIQFTLLAIDVPKNNEQTPKAVEHIFAHLSAIQKHGTLYERYFEGFSQPAFSLEIVSIEGYIQFLIRTPVKFRDLVEAAIYAQYPDAEITEVEDYIDSVPKPLDYPKNTEYNMWGTEFKLTNKQLYPIKTYPSFEHPLTQTFLDPMASLLEIFSRFGPGEQLWLQIVTTPSDNHWREAGIALIRKLVGKKTESHGADWLYFPREIFRGLSESFTAGIIPTTSEGEAHKKNDNDPPSLMLHLSPDERSTVEAVGMKISKMGFLSKIRMIYTARKEVYNRGKGVDAVIGAIKQFNTLDLNGFTLNKKTRTKVHYINVKRRLLWRKRRILWGYRYRSLKRGRSKFILNTEELATLFHFPVLTVKAPMVQKADTKKAEPPSRLPTETLFPAVSHAARVEREEAAAKKGEAPTNLPIA